MVYILTLVFFLQQDVIMSKSVTTLNKTDCEINGQMMKEDYLSKKFKLGNTDLEILEIQINCKVYTRST